MYNYHIKRKLLPQFSNINLDNFIIEFNDITKFCKNNVIEIISKNKKNLTWNNFYQPMLELNNYLENKWSILNHLNSVKNNKKIRKIYKKSLKIIYKYNIWFNNNKKIYNTYLKFKKGKNFLKLNNHQKKSVKNTIINFELNGAKLTEKNKKKYNKIIILLSKLKFKYDNNILDSIINWNKLIVNKKLLFGVSETFLKLAKKKAQDKNKIGWLLTLDFPSYYSVMTQCENKEIRKDLYTAYITKASDIGPNAGKWDNSIIINKILKLRNKISKLLGFNNFSEKTLILNIANKPKIVLNFIKKLIDIILPKAKIEYQKIKDFINKKFSINKIDPWDILFYCEKQKKDIFLINEEYLRNFFPINKVLKGLFKITNCIFGIYFIERNDIDVWDNEVRFFEIFDKNKNLKGGFYLDLYARENKKSGAWMDICTSRMKKNNGEIQFPIAYIICNFMHSINKCNATLTHDEVITLFHEFGHCLQHVLTNVDILDLSGINGIPWDAIELSSQFMENFCWEINSINLISEHFKTKKSIPNKMINNILKYRKYNAALNILNTLRLSLFDLYIHMNFNNIENKDITTIMNEIRQKTLILPYSKLERIAHSFPHIFSGGYSSKYYSYLWSNILSSDIWLKFKKKGILNKKIGNNFLNLILSKGGAENIMHSFIKLMSREPKINSMLKLYGIN